MAEVGYDSRTFASGPDQCLFIILQFVSHTPCHYKESSLYMNSVGAARLPQHDRWLFRNTVIPFTQHTAKISL